MDYLPLILTSLISIFTTGAAAKLLTLRQDKRKLESAIDIEQTRTLFDISEIHKSLRDSVLDELSRKDSDCSNRIDKLKLDYESKIQRIEEIHEEETAILHDKIDGLISRVTQLELENEKLKV